MDPQFHVECKVVIIPKRKINALSLPSGMNKTGGRPEVSM